jgi:hypothetical protein
MITVNDLEFVEGMKESDSFWFYESFNHYYIYQKKNHYELVVCRLVNNGEDVETKAYSCSGFDTALETIAEIEEGKEV